MTLSHKRIEDTFGAAEQTATYKSKKGADHPQRTLVDKDRAANTSWAKAVFSAFGMAADFSCVPSLPKRRQTQMPVQHDELGIALLNGERFEYDKTQVPEPPTIHLSQDIDQLCKEWESSNLLCVGGRGIPVKYWGEFYKRGKGVKNTAWDALRFIAEECQHYPDTASFWHAFSDGNGKRFSYQQILNCIADRRISAAAQDANDAHTFFDGNLDHPLAQGAFQYTKGGKSYVSSKDDAIAKKWHELLATQPDISSRVLAAQSSSQ
ncbi:hypothetical protein F4604DRAFT_1679332 [Suillus subluteus]|nr:hypothetical protein F4604DRAFT_1679332 [Suillus subluteus]